MPSPPIGTAYIAAIFKKLGYRVQVIDAAAEGFYDVEKYKFNTYIFGLNIENTVRLIKPDTDVVCFSFMFTNNWYFDRELVTAVRKSFLNAVIIGGGEHATAVPEYCLRTSPEIDYLVLGEGEATIEELMNCIVKRLSMDEINRIAYRKNDRIHVNNFSRRLKRVNSIDEIPWPAWELFPLDKYFAYKITYGVYRGNNLPVLASRGCPYDCTFCSSPQMWGKKYSLRRVNDVVDEMEYYYKKYNVTSFDFFDLTAIIYKDWIISLCREILNRGLNITYQIPAGTRAEAIDLEVAQMLHRSGCKNITYAPESGSPKILKAIRKRVNLDNIYSSIKYSNKVGMNIKLNIIVGLPDETHLDIWKTIWFLIRSSWYGAHDMYPGVFSPYPGSALYERLLSEGKINLYTDEYIEEIISSHDLWPGKTYDDEVSPSAVKIYTLVMFAAFYGSNFLFRPIRLVRFLHNILTNRHESRAELVLSQTFTKFRLSKQKQRPVNPITNRE
jgi:radical SAM superfamily enzyme YgiQ (UPF0313 family)